ncbi:hypothetical protein [Kerstersia gyiorum]|uniref:hypothetical protein n=1 Tax=Kerstersia gyiorum TaxID=206506 RepID=UPI0020A21EB4|nr:hypothetical protein [Kerstersia gyiorum]MCP1679444.1 hypothetical protein [Kerstersia gyiorum]MCP1823947.1 hypothetical protein [Kerstersia gyiorum]MCP1827388.1 hypothetical protein [Kerstersia gyiorum]MCW2448963.1 hypothetical protein [Kerstersia gyiorum]
MSQRYDYQAIAAAMQQYGGRFVRGLGAALAAADASNAARLAAAFPEIMDRYADAAMHMRIAA